MSLNTRAWLMAAGGAGAVAGFLSGVPIISALNCLFCAWIWMGGIGAIGIYTRMDKTALTTGQGMIIGASSGVVAAFVGGFISFIFGLIMGAANVGMMSQLRNLPGGRDMPNFLPEAGAGMGALLMFACFGILISLVLYAGFGALAGWVGVELFGRQRQSLNPPQ